jgi:hypothetical protein
MKMTAKGTILLLMVIALVTSWDAWRKLRPGTLSSWVQQVQRPGYRLLYSTETDDHSYYAIFDAGDDYLAFCSLEKRRPGAAPRP